MYYLNDKHTDYQYALYVRIKSGTPFISSIYETEIDLWRDLQYTIKKHNQYNRIYYIDYKNYKNDYEKNNNGFYYKILKRKVNDWKEVA